MGISLGLVGLGAFGSSFAPLFKSHPLVDRIALCDREPERLKAWAERESFRDKFDPKDAHDSLEAICRSDVDALVIITQHFLHAPQAVQALESGKHVYSAVPVISVPDSDEILDWCDRIVRTVERTGMRYMLGETTYYRPQAMYCRRRAAEGAFGRFVYAEGEYFHDVDHGLREVKARREGSASGQEWLRLARKKYRDRGIVGGPMHYPTHSTSGPISVMGAHAVKVCAWAQYTEADPEYHQGAPANETALFTMSNGAHMRICEYRRIGHRGREMFRVYGDRASFEHDTWCTRGTFEFEKWNIKDATTPLTVDQMRDRLPEEVSKAFVAEKTGSIEGAARLSAQEREDFLGGHGGSHAYLVHEFVDAIAHGRMPAINAWEAARYTAAGATAHKSALKDGEILDVPDWGDAPE